MAIFQVETLRHQFAHPISKNALEGPLNTWEGMRKITRPTFAQVLQYLPQVMQGDCIFTRTEESRNAYLVYAESLMKQGRKPVDDIRAEAQGDYYIKRNLFPYELHDAEHWLLFLMQNHCTFEGAEKYLHWWCEEMEICPSRVIAYQNQGYQRSMPELPHLQLIIEGRVEI